jgi:Xaa-Pro aminopeptidase
MTYELFPANIYVQRRARLRALLAERNITTGLVLICGNHEAPMNYADNVYPFRQDSSFLYFFGLAEPCRYGVIDLDEGNDTLYGDDPSLDSIVWTGPVPAIAELAALVGSGQSGSLSALSRRLQLQQGRAQKVHYLAPYRADTVMWLSEQLALPVAQVRQGYSRALTAAVVRLREIKAPEEIAEMERALVVTAEMHHAAMRASRPGVRESAVVGEMEGIMRRHDWQLAYPVIFSRNGEVLHNHGHSNVLVAGDLIVNDTGCSSPLGYASDITRTIPVGGQLTGLQRELYDTVLRAQQSVIGVLKPGIAFADMHRLASGVLVDGLRDLGVFRGSTDDILASGAYAMIFQCGLGHQIGLDVHDMESLGEDQVGYDDAHHRSPLFGLRSLRLAKKLVAGMVVTVEPGYYFIAQQQQLWRAEGRYTDFINYDALAAITAVKGIRIEDDVLITPDACRELGPHIARTADEVEAVMA